MLAAIGLWYDDFDGVNPITKNLLSVYGYTTGVEKNDTAFKSKFPFVQTPWSGTHVCNCGEDNQKEEKRSMGAFPMEQKLRLANPEIFASNSPNPVVNTSTLKYKVDASSRVKIIVYDVSGKALKVLADKKQEAGTYTLQWNAASLTKGTYFIGISKNGSMTQTLPLVKAQ